jgi:hypothetical protein
MILPTFIFYFTNRFDLALMVYKIKKINGSQKESIMLDIGGIIEDHC